MVIMENTLLIEALIKEKRDLNERIKAINLLLSSYGYNVDSDKLKEKALELATDLKLKQTLFDRFPTNGRKDKQILWLFNNFFNRGIKLQDLQNKYNEIRGVDNKGKEIRIDNIARRLKRDKKLVVVKYNGLNKNSFWGLPEWIDGDNFDPEHIPDESKLPIDIEFSEVVTGD